MTFEQLKEILFAKLLIKQIDNINGPLLLYKRERPVVKMALLKYIELIEAEARNQEEGEQG